MGGLGPGPLGPLPKSGPGGGSSVALLVLDYNFINNYCYKGYHSTDYIITVLQSRIMMSSIDGIYNVRVRCQGHQYYTFRL